MVATRSGNSPAMIVYDAVRKDAAATPSNIRTINAKEMNGRPFGTRSKILKHKPSRYFTHNSQQDDVTNPKAMVAEPQTRRPICTRMLGDILATIFPNRGDVVMIISS
jgi:hypothetical protein